MTFPPRDATSKVWSWIPRDAKEMKSSPLEMSTSSFVCKVLCSFQLVVISRKSTRASDLDQASTKTLTNDCDFLSSPIFHLPPDVYHINCSYTAPTNPSGTFFLSLTFISYSTFFMTEAADNRTAWPYPSG